MLIKLNCLMPVLATFIVSKMCLMSQNNGSGRPRLVAVVFSLNCSGNDLKFCQLSSVKATKHYQVYHFSLQVENA